MCGGFLGQIDKLDFPSLTFQVFYSLLFSLVGHLIFYFFLELSVCMARNKYWLFIGLLILAIRKYYY